MALTPVLDTLDGVDSGLAEHYVERPQEQGGGYMLDVKSVNGLQLADVGKMTQALQRERQNAKAAQDKLKLFEGIEDPAQAREALAKMEEISNWDPEQKLAEAKKTFEANLTKKFETDSMKIKQEAQAQIAALTTSNQTLTQKLASLTSGQLADQAIAKFNGNAKLLRPFILQQTRTRFDSESGEFVTEVLDNVGQPRLSRKAGDFQSPMTVEELVEEMSSDESYGPLFNASGQSGSGATGGNTQTRRTGSAITITEAEAQDPMKYRAAKKQAEEAGLQLQIR